MRILLRSLLVFLALMAGMAAAGRAQTPAQVVQNCQGGIAPPVDFGAFYSWELYKSQNSRQFDSSFQCNFFSLVNLGTNSELKVTALSANGGSMVASSGGAFRVPYKLYSDAKSTINLPFGQQVNLPQGGLSFLGLGGSVGGSVQLFLETQANAVPIAGKYTDIISLRWEWGYCSFGALGFCAPFFWHSGTANTTVNVAINVRKSCNINGATATLNFGAQPLVSMFKSSTANLEVYCTLLAPYKFYVDDGENPANGMRRMKGPGNNYIEYQLYQPGTGNIISQGAPLNGTGMGLNQSIAIEGRINTQQADVPVGAYMDRPIMTIEY